MEKKIRRYTPTALKLFNVISSDIGRPIADITSNLESVNLQDLITDAIAQGKVQEMEVQDKDAHWYMLRIRPYNIHDQKNEGAVIALLDINKLKQNQSELKTARQDALDSVEKLKGANEFAETIIGTIREPLLVLDGDLRVVSANKSFFKFFKVTKELTVGRFIYELGDGQWNIPQLRKLLEEILPQSNSFEDFEMDHVFPIIGHKKMLLNARQLSRGVDQKQKMILLALEETHKINEGKL